MQIESTAARDATDTAVEAAIETCVRSFYEKGAKDALLGPIFDNAIPNLENHMEPVTNFWSKALLGTER